MSVIVALRDTLSLGEEIVSMLRRKTFYHSQLRTE